MQFFKPQVSFCLSIASPFSVVTHEFFIFFRSTFYTLDKKVSQSANFKIFECSSEVHQIPHDIYEITIHFSFSF